MTDADETKNAEKPAKTESSPPKRDSTAATRLGPNWQRLGYRRIVQLLVYLVIIPTVLLLSIGIILMFFEGRINLLFGILTVSFVSVVITGIVLVIVFVRREANLSELQADFISKVSHELRTPLTAIRLFAETLERTREDEKTQTQIIELMIDETERLTRLINRLLDWGRMQSGRKLYEMRPERVSAIVEDAKLAFAPQRYHDAIDFDTEVEPDLPEVVADRAAVVDALVNLLSNARKYGGSPPMVRLTAKKNAKGDVEICVSDNGEGIPRPEQRRIFEKFYRIDDRLSRTREGSGLGLAIVQHIAKAHGARVVVDSEKGRGSTFRFILEPRIEKNAESEPGSERTTEPKTETPKQDSASGIATGSAKIAVKAK